MSQTLGLGLGLGPTEYGPNTKIRTHIWVRISGMGCYNVSEPHISTKTPRIEDLMEMDRKQIDRDKPYSHGGPCGSSVQRISNSLFRKRYILSLFKEVRDAKLRLLHWSDRPRSALSCISGQHGGSLP